MVATTGLLREVNLSGIADDTKASLANFFNWWAGIDPDRRRQLEDRADELRNAPPSRRGRPPLYGVDHWKNVAAIAGGDVLNPTKAVVKHFTVTPSTANKWIKKARSLGFVIEQEEKS
jgi:hypothetical protein